MRTFIKCGGGGGCSFPVNTLKEDLISYVDNICSDFNGDHVCHADF